MNQVLRIAIVGSGPAALYAAAELAKQPNLPIQVNMIDRLPCIGGLVRAGVAPDHSDRRLVIDAYEKLARSAGRFEFFGNIELGNDISHDELLAHHHGVIYATGAAGSQPLDVPGATLNGCHASNEFVGWYNGHPDYADLDVDLSSKRAVVIGNGNVALDIARLLLKSDDELAITDTADHARAALRESNVTEVIVLGRRGPLQASFTHPELLELGSLPNVAVQVDPVDINANEWPNDNFSLSMRRSCLERYAATNSSAAKKTLQLKFLASPVSIQGDARVCSLTITKNRLQAESDGRVRAVATEEITEIETGLIVHAIGYRASSLPGLSFDADKAVIPNEHGRVVGSAGAYVTGWIKRGPRGVIGSNKVCAVETVTSLLSDAASGKLRSPANDNQRFLRLVRLRQPDLVDYRGWKAIDQHERDSAVEGAPRRKACSVAEMIKIAKAVSY